MRDVLLTLCTFGGRSSWKISTLSSPQTWQVIMFDYRLWSRLKFTMLFLLCQRPSAGWAVEKAFSKLVTRVYGDKGKNSHISLVLLKSRLNILCTCLVKPCYTDNSNHFSFTVRVKEITYSVTYHISSKRSIPHTKTFSRPTLSVVRPTFWISARLVILRTDCNGTAVLTWTLLRI